MVGPVLSAEHFDRWYADREASSSADRMMRRVLRLPEGVDSTGMLGGDGLDEVVGLLALRPGQVLLDLACGRGGYGLEIARRTGCGLIGVDFSAVAIAQARERAPEARFEVGTLTATGLPGASVDAVLVADSLQFADPKVAALRECLRVLVPGGRLVVTCWQPRVPGDKSASRLMWDLDLARQLPEAGFADAVVRDRPQWLDLEKRVWEEVLAADASGDPALESLRREARLVLPRFGKRRRVLATATAPTT
ncbi:Methyltransferase domain-containing protein [Lentzea fradiae]|uniref:Methyltransferase domain-containing protein n=1 Tax=Lentzea fradiae TaxID=200378 RepID=A0A1G7V9U3_9PSEU|nr:class I SAM-dependent methyltransferase [Lentzea fradiae]SDG56533.1 Methyltransferase domain-containing protein [Lentzea fradiae]